MKISGRVFECVDFRTTGKPLAGIARLATFPGVLDVELFASRSEQFILEDEDALEFDSEHQMVTLHTPEGRLTFVEVTLADFERFDGPMFYDTPKFSSTQALHRYFYSRIEQRF